MHHQIHQVNQITASHNVAMRWYVRYARSFSLEQATGMCRGDTKLIFALNKDKMFMITRDMTLSKMQLQLLPFLVLPSLYETKGNLSPVQFEVKISVQYNITFMLHNTI